MTIGIVGLPHYFPDGFLFMKNKEKDFEIWKTAIYDGEVYEGLYKVSNLGRILSLNYRNTGRAELMNPNKNKGGYFQVTLRKNKESKKCYVHRLVAETFLPNPENKPYINHKIEGKKGKTMNFVFFNEDGTVDEEKSTIEWVTAKENNNYGTHNERIAKTLSKKVLQLSLSGDLIREWSSAKECGRNGFNSGNIVECCNGNRKKHKGFLWIYAEDYKEKFGYIPLF